MVSALVGLVTDSRLVVGLGALAVGEVEQSVPECLVIPTFVVTGVGRLGSIVRAGSVGGSALVGAETEGEGGCGVRL